MADDRYDRVIFRGHTVDKMTRDALLHVEKHLGYELTIIQGSYHTGVAASAGTHDGGGCIDLAPYDWERKVYQLRMAGFAAWHRTPAQGFSEHIHACQIGNAKLASLAATQVAAYKKGYNGLGAGGMGGKDDGPKVWIRLAKYAYRKCFPTWVYPVHAHQYRP